jgi:hypothetical protein
MLPEPVLFQRFQPVTRRNSQGIQGNHGIKLIKFPLRNRPNALRTGAASFHRTSPIKDILSALVEERFDHSLNPPPIKYFQFKI